MPSPIADLLQSAATRANLMFLREGVAPVLLEQRDFIARDTRGLEAQLHHIDVEITRLHALREQVGAQLAFSCAMLAPVHRLPPELLAHIFIELASTYVDSWRTRIISSTVARVSATWRAVAYSIPEIWTNVSLRSAAADDYPHIDACVSASRTHPLHIYGEYASGPGALESQLARLIPEAYRWKTLSLSKYYMSELPRALICDLPCLERAILHPTLPPSHLDLGDPRMFDFLVAAPRLHHLDLIMDDVPWHYRLSLPAPCALTTLSLKCYSCTIDTVLPLIRQSSSTLRHLSLVASTHCGISADAEELINMPRLESIDMAECMYPILGRIHAPHVEKITGRCLLQQTLDTTRLTLLLGYLAPRGESWIRNVPHLQLIDYHCQPPAASVPSALRLLNLLRQMDHLRVLYMDVSPGARATHTNFFPTEQFVDNMGMIDFLPNLVELSLRVHPSPGSQKVLEDGLRLMLRRRAPPSGVEGRNVVALERFETNIICDLPTKTVVIQVP
ncbi:hypothetical protein HDZ31DRAFT_36560 [Schizophyllum fasciatum]